MAKEPFIDGVPELLLLRLLGRREMYGYELISEIQKQSNGTFSFGEGSVYPILHRLVKQKQLSIRKETVSGRPRRYYTLTQAGQTRLAQMEQSWRTISTAVESFRGDLGYAGT